METSAHGHAGEQASPHADTKLYIRKGPFWNHLASPIPEDRKLPHRTVSRIPLLFEFFGAQTYINPSDYHKVDSHGQPAFFPFVDSDCTHHDLQLQPVANTRMDFLLDYPSSDHHFPADGCPHPAQQLALYIKSRVCSI